MYDSRVALVLVLLAPCMAVATATTPASAAPTVSFLTPVEGFPDDVVVNNTHAFAAVAAQDRVQVLSLAAKTLEASIPVGTRPVSLDFSADGSMLYVANADSNDVSVVDVALRREVRRFPAPVTPRVGKPFSIAVANNGTALLSRTGYGVSTALHLLTIDLATGAMRERTDRFGDLHYHAKLLRPSGDRSRIGIAEPGVVSVYEAGTDSFGPRRGPGGTDFLALDGTGSKILVGADTRVFDRDLVLRATVPGPGDTPATRVTDVAVGAAGATAYRLRGGVVEVVDLSRALVTAAIALPEPAADYKGRLALTPDGTTLVALTRTGFSVVPVAAASARTCTLPAAPAGVLPICGAPLTDLVSDGRGRAFVTNTARNQIEVVSLTGRRVEASIPVGSQPTSLDLSPDGLTLYVVNSGADDVSVVDVAQRREIRRITVPGRNVSDGPGRLVSIAVAGNGKALLTAQEIPTERILPLLEIDLLTGAVRSRLDVPGPALHVRSSGDHRRIGVVPGRHLDPVFAYDEATDSFTRGKLVSGGLFQVALDGDGTEMLVGGGEEGWEPSVYHLDHELVRRGTVGPPEAKGITVSRDGSRLFSLQYDTATVTDLERGVTVRSVPLPEPIGYRLGALALTPDESALAVLSVSGVGFASTSGGQPTGCPPPPAVAGLSAVCGELGDVLTVGGKAYVTNVTFNRVEVMSLSDGTLEAPILVGSRPRGLDVSADGRLLYIALSGAEEVSVVDMTEQRELRRITVPSAVAHMDRPSAVAVTSSGIALVTTQSAGMSYGVINQIDLETEIPSRRGDFDTYGFVSSHMPLARSADRERVLAVGRHSDGQVSAYRSDTDSFGPPQRLSAYLAFAALDGTGQRGLLDNGMVLDAGLRVLGEVPGAGKGVAVNRAGTTGYRVRELEVEVIDLSTATVVRTLPLPQPVGAARGAIALSADERSLAVLTGSGVSLLAADPASARALYAVWAQPESTPLEGTGTWVAIAAEPKAQAGQLSASYMFASYFIFANSGVVGAVALVTQPAGKFAVFTVAEAGGPSRVAVVPFQWRAGGSYFLLAHQIAAGRWAAYVYGPDAAGPVLIGTLSVPAGWGKLSPVTVTVSSWIGDPGRTCGAYPLADLMYHPPIGFAGSGHTTANRALTDQTAGACAGRSSVELGVWDRHRLGNGA